MTHSQLYNLIQLSRLSGYRPSDLYFIQKLQKQADDCDLSREDSERLEKLARARREEVRGLERR